MANITAADVNKLRQQTGAGMMDCRKALVESDGDFEKAVDYLRKKGQKVAALRSDRETKEGVIIAKTSADGKTGVIVGLGCETDFVAKNEDFIKFAQSIVDLALANGISSAEELNGATLDGATVADKVNDQVAKIGEKITLSKFEKVTAAAVVAYIHGNYRMGVLVGFSKEVSEETGKDVAMQIAAMNPIAVDADGVAPELIAREREIAVEQIKAEGKPAEMAEKIAQGKIAKFFKESTLLQQAFVKDGNKSVADHLKSVDADLKVTEFKRVALG
ncbi:translation elongation factor Ts [Chitinophaga pendula]|uniref:translation elongation factor Ts n=1 Tax=Chitinophaga TaxID=79328 RepID=UPI000BAE8166|nr:MULTISPECIES: translation elongation factor Ts [Chitinophaga]ASZ10496.1 elongation factor Ts [Chitinophaga sp. MD30]UCJ06531.1 translation elongation factor Ts [Chitinophaga pendula]